MRNIRRFLLSFMLLAMVVQVYAGTIVDYSDRSNWAELSSGSSSST